MINANIFNPDMKIEFFNSPYHHVIVSNFLKEGVFRDIKEKLPKWDDFPDKVQRGGRKDLSNFHYGNFGSINSHFKNNHNLESLYLSMSSELFRKFCLDHFQVKDNKSNPNLKLPITFDICIARDSYINIPHVDGDYHLVSGLFYFGNEKIKSGGNILLHKNPSDSLFKKNYRDKDIEKVVIEKKIPPVGNTLVFWLNSPDSIHSTDNLIGERNFLYFSIDSEKTPALPRPWSSIKSQFKAISGVRRNIKPSIFKRFNDILNSSN